MTKPMGLEVANNSCLVGTKHHVGDSTRTSKGDYKTPCSKEPCKGMSCHILLFNRSSTRGAHLSDLSKNRKIVHVTVRPSCLLLAGQKLVKAELGAPDILFLLLLPESCSRGGLHCVIITWFANDSWQSLLAFPPQTSFSAAHSDSNIRISLG